MSLLAGAATTDITPLLGTSLVGLFNDRKAEDVESPLHAKALVLDDGTTRLALVILDLIGIPAAYVRQIRTRVYETTGIPSEHVLIACTHTHTGPSIEDVYNCIHDEAYIRWMLPRVADSVRLAVRRLQPARIAWGQGELADHLFCRRFRMRDGSVVMNPGRSNPDIVEPVSPIDPVVGVLYVENLQGRPLAVVCRYSLHYVGTDNSNAISSDYYGHFANIMGRMLGTDCTTMLFNGTSGQINNVDISNPHQHSGQKQALSVATALAGEVLKVIGRMQLQDTCLLKAAVSPILLPRKQVTEADLEATRTILETGKLPNAQPFSWLVGPIPESIAKICAQDMEALAAMPLQLPSEVQVLRIGDTAWVGLPGEIFTEIGMAIRAGAPVPHTFAIELANDNRGYIATDKALLEEGGYETFASCWSPVGPGAEGILVHTALSLLRDLFAPETSAVCG